MSMLLYDLSPPQNAVPREFDLSSSRIALVGDRGCGKTSLALRWCYGSLHSTGAREHLASEDICHRCFLRPALRQSRSWAEYFELQMRLRSNFSGDGPGVGRSASIDSTATSQSGSGLGADNNTAANELRLRHKDTLDVQVLEGADFEQIDYSELAALQAFQTDGFMLCFDVTSAKSFETVQLMYQQVWKLRGDDVPMVLCALKADVAQEDRAVGPEQIAEFCDELQIDIDVSFFEVSAFEDFNINESFYRLLRDIELRKDSLRRTRLASKDMVSEESGTMTATTLALDQSAAGETSAVELDDETLPTLPVHGVPRAAPQAAETAPVLSRSPEASPTLHTPRAKSAPVLRAERSTRSSRPPSATGVSPMRGGAAPKSKHTCCVIC
ncbi:LAQU0S11e01882g1_1 [Lachancea quebecensis]|uniref:LAQU0S11e01882g1_1 n=1 Tax=Lachancea quebecensis TaxID=1654605 RepID=A0A0P1KTZ3_9SACH|nr:LAQU0S11e01882g1_1 [Lachancea quebecensis]